MIGAIVGDIVDSVYEFNNIRTMEFPFLSKISLFTDDTVMALAVSKWLLEDEMRLPDKLVKLYV